MYNHVELMTAVLHGKVLTSFNIERAFHQPGKPSACIVTVLSQCLTSVSLHLDRMNYILHATTLKYTVLSSMSPQCTEPAHSSSTEFQCTPQAASLASA